MSAAIEGIKQQLELTTRRLNELRAAYAIAYDANQRFAYGEQISQLEKEVADLNLRLKDAYGLEMLETSSILEGLVRQLTIDQDIGEIHLVNCNREPSARNFWKAFDNFTSRNNRFQFYFIVACPTQQPTSFAERMVYEVLIQELEAQTDAIDYPHRPDSRRVLVEDLPLGRNLAIAQREFKKYFSRRFGLGNTETSFEDYLRTGLPQLQYEYVASVFDLNASRWNMDVMAPYLRWIMDIFTDTPLNIPNFIFFFVVFLRNAHIQPLQNPEKEIFEDVARIVGDNLHRATLISDLVPVPTELLEDWIRDLGELSQSKIQDVVKAIVAELPPEKQDQYQRDRLLDMTDIERFQALVYKIANARG